MITLIAAAGTAMYYGLGRWCWRHGLPAASVLAALCSAACMWVTLVSGIVTLLGAS